MRVEVVYCPRPHETDLSVLDLPAGATLAQALAASGVCARHGLDPAAVTAGLWGKVREADTPLRERDRVEVYRPLVVDPKEARRQRYARHKERLAGIQAVQQRRRPPASKAVEAAGAGAGDAARPDAAR